MHQVTLENRSLAEQAADSIERLIIDKEFKPGDRLPNEREFLSLLGVGRGTIREAMKSLESRNVVEIRRGKGTFVCKQVGRVSDPLGFRFAHNKKKLAEDLSVLRCMLEPNIAALAAKMATEQDIEELQALCVELESLIKSGADYSQKDIEFHIKIANMTDNTVIPQIIPLITQGISMYVDLTNHALAGTSIITHKAVMDAIRNHDAEVAYEAMLAHMNENRLNLELLNKKDK